MTNDWTAGQVEARLIEWWETLCKLPDKELGWLYGSKTYWPDIRREYLEVWVNALEAEGRHDDMKSPHVPATPDEIKRYEDASTWFSWLPRTSDKKLVALVIYKMRYQSRIHWDEVGRKLEFRAHRSTVKRRYERCIDLMICHLNAREISH